MEKGKPANSIPSNYAEDNGLIYPSFVNSPPKFQNGLNDLNTYLESNVRVYLRDIGIFQNNSATVLFELTINEFGKVDSVIINESSAQTCGFSYECHHLEDEIRKVIEEMPLWTPAMYNNASISLRVALPLKFNLNENSIYILPSKYIFLFNNRK